MKRLVVSLLLTMSVTLLGVRSASAVSIDIVPSVASVNPGDPFSVNIVASGLSAAAFPADIVSAFDVLVSYDTSVLTPTPGGFSFTDYLGNQAGLFPDVYNSANLGLDPFVTSGYAELYAVSLLSDVDLRALQQPLYPDLLLATIDFTANGSISNNTVPNLAFVWDAAQGYDVKGSSMRGLPQIIYPATVPEPSTVLLMAIGMAGVGLGRRKLRA